MTIQSTGIELLIFSSDLILNHHCTQITCERGDFYIYEDHVRFHFENN